VKELAEKNQQDEFGLVNCNAKRRACTVSVMLTIIKKEN
jgi:hypothetical protein